MKNIFLLVLVIITIFCRAQTYPLRTYRINFSKNSYVTDTNNELPQYEGVWKATWNNKTIFIAFKKIKLYLDHNIGSEYYKDVLIAKFKVLDNSGNILFDNTNVADNKAKIEGGTFRKKDDKYSFSYIDNDLCGITRYIMINFTDSSKAQLKWEYWKDNDWLDSDCFYWNLPASQRPEPLPYSIILTKQ